MPLADRLIFGVVGVALVAVPVYGFVTGDWAPVALFFIALVLTVVLGAILDSQR